MSKVLYLWGICPTSENHEQLYIALQQTMGRWKDSLELFARIVLLQHHSPAEHRDAARTILCFRTWIELQNYLWVFEKADFRELHICALSDE
ncbi:MAG: hypothetical protein K0Q96_243 [Rubrobacteraceae bacterium]|jgi:hypothetical protein|nr:hypothetical protein [Rubrobacteraceae bacterium]